MENMLHRDKYYTCMDYMLEVYEKECRQNKFCATEVEEAECWREEVREILRQITGLKRMGRCSLEAVLIERVELEVCIREKLLIQVEPKVWMPFYVLVPYGMSVGERRACVIAPHGHQGAGKESIVGKSEIPAVKCKIEEFNYDYGMQFVREGYIVFCPDARGFGERRESTKQTDKEKDFLTSTCSQLSNMAIPLGRSVAGMCTWDLMRLIDYIETREDCDKTKLGCAGFSGGGMQTLWLMALDERIKYGVISGYFYGYKDSLLKLSGNCACNYVPHLWEHVDMGDIGALIAPRPLLVQSAKQDKLNGERGLDNVMEQLAITREAYKLFGEEDKLSHDIVEGGHKWHEEAPIQFVKEQLGCI